MLALLLLGALVGQTLAAPSNCAEFCDDQTVGSGYTGQAKSSYSSYAKSSSYNSGLRRSGSSSGGLGLTGGRLENLDENAIGVSSGTPGTWRDEKHYVTDDGRGEMSYRAGQTVTGNGYSKFAEHSYSYGTHESHTPKANSQILSTAEFNRELQNMQSRINSFMGTFSLGANSVVNANVLQDFKNKASLINNQLSNVCDQVDSGSSMYQQMHQMQLDFLRNVERIQQQMESMIFRSSSSTSSEIVHPTYPGPQPIPSSPAPIHQLPDVKINEAVIQEVSDNFRRVSQEIGSFYEKFAKTSIEQLQKPNVIAEGNSILQRLAELEAEAVVKPELCAAIGQSRSSFQTYYSTLVSRLQEQENRALKEAREQIENQLRQESAKYADSTRQLEQQKLEIERQLQLKKQQHEEFALQLQEHEELARKQQQEALRRQEQEELRRQQAELARRQEELRLQRQEVERVPVQPSPVQPTPTTGSLHVSSSSSYEHKFQTSGSYEAPRPTSSSSAYTRGSTGQSHLDLTALTNKLQQDLYRIQNDISNFNAYTMRLTAANSESVLAEAERQAQALRQRIDSLCQTSDRYQNQNIHSSAEALQRRFEEIVRSFENQAANYAAGSSQQQGGFAASAGYSSHSSYGTSGSLQASQAPSITNIEYEHSKSTEVEVSRRPVTGTATSQRYAQQQQQQQVDCVEAYANQPCLETSGRYRRQAGGN